MSRIKNIFYVRDLRQTLFFSLLSFILILLSAQAHAQVEVHAVLDSNKIRIGEQTRLDLYLSYDASTNKNLNIQWPQIEDTLRKEIEVLNITKIDTTIPDKSRPNFIQQHIQLLITSFDSGYYAIPPFEFVLNNDTSNKLLTEALLLEVNSVPTDTSAAKLKDIKAPFDEPFDWKWYLPYVYIALAILTAIIIIILIVRRIKKNKPVEVIPEKPKTPAHITAFAALEKIKEEGIWKDNKIKEYYSEITDTIRLYIEERFNINALELTSDEIIHVFKSQVVDSESKAKLYQILTLSDFVKFAKQIPIEAEHTLTLNNAFDFVKGTMREDEIIIHQEVINDYNNYTQKQVQNNKITENIVQSNNVIKENIVKESKSNLIENNSTGQLKKKINSKKKIGFIIGSILGVIVIFGLGYLIQKFFAHKEQDSIKEMMLPIAKGLNQSCPIMLDSETRLDSSSVSTESIFQYHYTLLNMLKVNVNIPELKQYIEPSIINNIKTNEQMKVLRDNSVTFEYIYSDKENNLITSILVTPSQYK